MSVWASGLQRNKLQRKAVDAIAQACGLRAIVEQMALMSAAAPAMHFCADHPRRGVALLTDGVGQRGPEAGPASAALELGGRGEQWQITSHAGEVTAPLLVQQGTGEWAFRVVLAQHRELRRGQLLAPFRIR